MIKVFQNPEIAIYEAPPVIRTVSYYFAETIRCARVAMPYQIFAFLRISKPIICEYNYRMEPDPIGRSRLIFGFSNLPIQSVEDPISCSPFGNIQCNIKISSKKCYGNLGVACLGPRVPAKDMDIIDFYWQTAFSWNCSVGSLVNAVGEKHRISNINAWASFSKQNPDFFMKSGDQNVSFYIDGYQQLAAYSIADLVQMFSTDATEVIRSKV